jgi:hypothetical protein
MHDTAVISIQNQLIKTKMTCLLLADNLLPRNIQVIHFSPPLVAANWRSLQNSSSASAAIAPSTCIIKKNLKINPA